MTVIYVDTLFLLNAVIDYLLLLASARLAGEPLRRIRFALGAGLGGLYAVGLFLPGFSFLSHPVYKLLSVCLMLLIAYGSSRRFIRQGLIFLALTCAFGGCVVALGMFGGQGLELGHGVFYSSMDVKMLFVSAAVCYAVITVVFQRLGRHSAVSELLPVRISLMERRVQLLALLDTGNTLTDPVTGCGVLVVEGEAVHGLFAEEYCPTGDELYDPAAAVTRLGQGAYSGRFRLLPYRAVGVSCGMLLTVKTDWIEVNGKKRTGALVALSPTPLSDGGGYRAVIGRDGIL